MHRRKLLGLALAAALLLVVAATVVAVRLANRGCSLDDQARAALAASVSPERVTPLLRDVLGHSGPADELLIEVPENSRDFALDQGPQRVCASGAAASTSRDESVNVLVRFYDSSGAARGNAASNLPSSFDTWVVDDTPVTAGAACTRPESDGCREHGAQAIVDRVSVVMLSRSLQPETLESLAVDLAIGLERLAG